MINGWWRVGRLVGAFAVAAMLAARARGAAETKPQQAPFELQEWVVLVVDPNRPGTNNGVLFKSTMPGFVLNRRSGANPEEHNDPSPVGVIRLYGDAKTDSIPKIDVLVRGSQFNAHWPKAQQKTDRVLWQDVELSGGPLGPQAVEPEHWFSRLRQGDSAHLKCGNNTENFLLYDFEAAYSAPLKVSGGAETGFLLSTSGATALRDICVYQPGEGGWRTGTAPDLKMGQRAVVTTKPSTTQPATTQSVEGVVITLAPDAVKQPVDLLAGWKKNLAATGLAPTDYDLIISLLSKHALDAKRLTVVYRMDESELNGLLPLEVTPLPKKQLRVGLVIVRNMDPSVGEEVDRLIAQLRDPDWSKRTAAHKQLAEIGIAAKPKLEQAANDKDAEVAWHAEQLLQVLTSTPPGR